MPPLLFRASVDSAAGGTKPSGPCLLPTEEDSGPWGFQRVRAQGDAGAGTGRGLCSFAHPSSLPSSPETSKFDTVSVGDAELWRPGLRRHRGCGGCDNCQAISRTDPRLSPAAVMSRDNCTTASQLARGKLGGAGTPGGGVMQFLVLSDTGWGRGLCKVVTAPSTPQESPP